MNQILAMVSAEIIIQTLHASMEMLKARTKDHDKFELVMDYERENDRLVIQYSYDGHLLLLGERDKAHGIGWYWSVHEALAPYVNEHGVLNLPDGKLNDAAAHLHF